MNTTTGPTPTRRLILQGAASVALIGLGNLPFAAGPARAGAAPNGRLPRPSSATPAAP